MNLCRYTYFLDSIYMLARPIVTISYTRLSVKLCQSDVDIKFKNTCKKKLKSTGCKSRASCLADACCLDKPSIYWRENHGMIGRLFRLIGGLTWSPRFLQIWTFLKSSQKKTKKMTTVDTIFQEGEDLKKKWNKIEADFDETNDHLNIEVTTTSLFS